MITETVLKTLGICGIVGAGTIAINEVTRVQKNKKAAELPVAEEVVEEDENIQKCKEVLNTTFSVDSEKLEKVLVGASYPQEHVKELVETIKNLAAPEETTVQAELVDEPKPPTFTVVEEPKMTQPNFSANDESKKASTKKQTTNNNNKKNN